MPAPYIRGGNVEIEVKGKKVVLRDKMPAKANWDLFQNFERFASGELDFDRIVDLLSRVVESWELEGDPHDTATYEEMDLFSEMMPLVSALSEIVSTWTESSKN